jgi:predicted phosphodiesterase
LKIAVASDVHLEFGQVVLENKENAEVLILSGDICVAYDIRQRDQYEIMGGRERSNRFHSFFQNCCEQFAHVIYVVGNHEHYEGDFAKTIPHLKEMLGYLPNLYILDREIKKFGDITFVCGTMWTDMNKGDALTLFHMKSMMNDFRCVTNSNNMVSRKVPLYKENPNYTEDGLNGGKYEQDENGYHIQIGHKFKQEPSKFTPEDAMEEFHKFIGYTKSVLPDLDKVVMVTHHTPSHTSCHPRYKTDKLMNGGYHSDLSEFILDNPKIKLWTHGHTHEDFDYMIGTTRVVCNPRGYINYEDRAETWDLKYFDV